MTKYRIAFEVEAEERSMAEDLGSIVLRFINSVDLSNEMQDDNPPKIISIEGQVWE